MESPFFVIESSVQHVPMVLSVPHCGAEFPEEVKGDFDDNLSQTPDDTDWFVHDLYRFARDLGITIVHARYSRWVIDLNRDPNSKPLYDDGRMLTTLTPTTDFLGRSIYKSAQHAPDEKEVQRRLDTYYWPYYRKLEAILHERRDEFGKVLLWDAHSIRRRVPTIRKDPFPDMILGDNDNKSADRTLIDSALEKLRQGLYQVNHNDPFKGGHITRYFGRPENQVHALQLEMNKMLYMDDSETKYDEQRASQVRTVLKPAFEDLILTLSSL